MIEMRIATAYLGGSAAPSPVPLPEAMSTAVAPDDAIRRCWRRRAADGGGGRSTARILALGGHDFTSRPPDRAVCELMLRLATERAGGRPRICILPTASGDTSEQIGRFYAAFCERPCEPSDLSLFRLGRRPMALRDHLLAQDLIYVGGGSLLNLLAVWEAHEISAILSLAWRQGIVLAGQSAGAMCWFEVGITKSSGKPAAERRPRPARRQPLRPLQQRARAPGRLPRCGGRRDARRLRARRLRRPALGGDGAAGRGHRSAGGPRLPGDRLARGRGDRGPASGPLPSRPRAGGPARGHRRVPPHHSYAQSAPAGWAEISRRRRAVGLSGRCRPRRGSHGRCSPRPAAGSPSPARRR